MKFTKFVPQEIEVKTLLVLAGVRYYEDGTVNGVEDTEGDLMPFVDKEDDFWKPIIEIETGKIIDWPKGTTAKIHYKVCDDGTYILQDADGVEVAKKEGYVPKFMSPSEDNYGDYIIMDIDENGIIKNWKFDVSCFYESND